MKTGEVQVWCINLDNTFSFTDGETDVLSHGERERAGRFRFPRDRQRFVLRHLALRLLLGDYLDEDPAGLIFTAGPNGKPALAGHRKNALSFNMSHSNGLALYAVALGCEVGIDVEWLRLEVDDMDMAQPYFSPCEADALSTMDPIQRRMAFYRLWTGKEAFLKATGLGLSFPPSRVEVSPEGSSRPGSVFVDAAASRWSYRPFTPADGYVAAVVAPGEGWTVTRHDAAWFGSRLALGTAQGSGLI